MATSKLIVRSFAMSIDGFSAGPNQSLDNPLGVNGPELMDWFFHTRVWREMHQQPGGDTGVDNEIAKQGFENVFGRCCSVRESRCSQASICASWVTNAHDTRRESARYIYSSAGTRDSGGGYQSPSC